MEAFIFIASIATFSFLAFTLIEHFLGLKKLKNLTVQQDAPLHVLPKISIVLTALDEEKVIEDAVKTLLHLNYPALEVITVNDRSTDNTPHILEKLKRQYPNLQVHHIAKLPAGWLGKNHALHVAAAQATGEWILFTDADVLMKPDTLRKTMSYALENKLDHLTLFEHHQRNQFWLKISLLGSYITYTMAMKPWLIRHPANKRSLGHGSFNLVKRASYEACGGHQAIALECLDDLKLGQLLKNNGFIQDTANGRDYVEREWYASLKEMIVGMQKNSFAYFNYRLWSTTGSGLLAFLFYLWPVIATATYSGPIRYVNLLNIILTFAISVTVAHHFRLPKRYGLFYPLGIAFMLYILFNSMIATYRNKGVIWRGTHYPLKLLRKGTQS